MERLKSMSREELLGLRGVWLATVQACELIIGRQIPWRKGADPGEVFWRQQGLQARPARALSQAGIRSAEDLRDLAREDVLALRGFSDASLRRLEEVLGRKLERRGAFSR
jgi:DNA-directed RNA polymerase alpha subunit